MTTENVFLKNLREKLLAAQAKEATIDKILGVIGKDDELDTLIAVAGWLTTSVAQKQLEEVGVSPGGIQADYRRDPAARRFCAHRDQER